MRALLDAQTNSNTIPEIFLEAYLNNKFPGEWKYTGGGEDSSFIVGRFPDFMNINGQKSVIEVLGSYWHRPELTGKTWEEEEAFKKEHYKKFGFDCICIWEEDCYLPKELDKVFDQKF